MDVGGMIATAAPWGGGALVLGMATLAARLFIDNRKLSLAGAKDGQAASAALTEQQNEIIKRQDKRIDELAEKLTLDRQLCDSQREAERRECDAKISDQRHEINGLAFSFDSLLMLMEVAPQDAPKHIQRIKELREQNRQERVARAAAIVARIEGKEHAD